jgi:ABC-2 type transport system ATP-binding protein
MAAIRTLTQRAVWLDHGNVMQVGATPDVVSAYLSSVGDDQGATVVDLTDETHRRSVTKSLARQVRFESVALLGPTGVPTLRLPEGAPIRLEIGFVVSERVRFLELVARVKSHEGTRLFSSYSGQQEGAVEPGRYRVVCEFPSTRLRPFDYHVELLARAGENQDIVPGALVFAVEQGHRQLDNPAYTSRVDGFFNVSSTWSELELAGAEASSAAARA